MIIKLQNKAKELLHNNGYIFIGCNQDEFEDILYVRKSSIENIFDVGTIKYYYAFVNPFEFFVYSREDKTKISRDFSFAWLVAEKEALADEFENYIDSYVSFKTEEIKNNQKDEKQINGVIYKLKYQAELIKKHIDGLHFQTSKKNTAQNEME